MAHFKYALGRLFKLLVSSSFISVLRKTVSIKEAYFLRYPHCVDGDSVASIQIVTSTVKILCGHGHLVPQLLHFLR